MQQRRRASSTSSQSSISDRDFSRSSSRTSIRQSPNILASNPPGLLALDCGRNNVPVIVLDPLVSQRKEKRKSVNLKREGG